MHLNQAQSVRMHLKYRGLVSITPEGESPMVITCEQGLLWITIAEVASDILLKAGASVELPPGRLAVVQALEAATFVLCDMSAKIAA